MFKENANCLNKHDMRVFLDWFLALGLTAVSSAAHIRAQLKSLKLERLAKIHVMCKDGRVPKPLSM